jgi:hypothetical protein
MTSVDSLQLGRGGERPDRGEGRASDASTGEHDDLAHGTTSNGFVRVRKVFADLGPSRQNCKAIPAGLSTPPTRLSDSPTWSPLA